MSPEQRQRASRRRQCVGKVRYHDQAQAKASKTRCEAVRGKPLKTYDCNFCHGWHLATAEELS